MIQPVSPDTNPFIGEHDIVTPYPLTSYDAAFVAYRDATHALHAVEVQHAAAKARWTEALADLNRVILGE